MPETNKQITSNKSIAARATITGLTHTINAAPETNAKKFLVTLKPVAKLNDAGSGQVNHCQCAHSNYARRNAIHIKSEDAIKGKTILNAFRLLTNSNFITVDQTYTLPKDDWLTPYLLEQKRLHGGKDTSSQRVCSCAKPNQSPSRAASPSAAHSTPKPPPAAQARRPRDACELVGSGSSVVYNTHCFGALCGGGKTDNSRQKKPKVEHKSRKPRAQAPQPPQQAPHTPQAPRTTTPSSQRTMSSARERACALLNAESSAVDHQCIREICKPRPIRKSEEFKIKPTPPASRSPTPVPAPRPRPPRLPDPNACRDECQLLNSESSIVLHPRCLAKTCKSIVLEADSHTVEVDHRHPPTPSPPSSPRRNAPSPVKHPLHSKRSLEAMAKAKHPHQRRLEPRSDPRSDPGSKPRLEPRPEERPASRPKARPTPRRPEQVMPSAVSVPQKASMPACFDSTRIGHLEQQIAEMRGELSRIKKEFIPQQEMVRYSVLATRLQELNAVLAEMKQNYLNNINDTLSRATTAYPAEEEQRCQYYSQHDLESKKYQDAQQQKQQQQEQQQQKQQKQQQRQRARGKQIWDRQQKQQQQKIYISRETEPERTETVSTFVQADPEKRKMTDKYTQATPQQQQQVCDYRTANKVQNAMSSNTSPPQQQQQQLQQKEVGRKQSYCQYCYRRSGKVLERNLTEAVMDLIGNRTSSHNVALTVLLQHNNLYHINVAILTTGEIIGCLLATEECIAEAQQRKLFENLLTFFIVDTRNTVEQKNRIIGHTDFQVG